MYYRSTRGAKGSVTASEAILKGLAEDGGLYVPEDFPRLPGSLKELSELDYRELARRILSCYLTDFTEEELRDCVDSAYNERNFDDPKIAPLRKLEGDFLLELFHGRTLAFKDMALSILPYLMKKSAEKTGLREKLVILTATSGDTGKAAMEGFSDVEGTEIIVFYPKDGVSAFQELQMRVQRGRNTHVAALFGNFDDAQSGVKRLFSDSAWRKKLRDRGIVLSSANSINIGRLLPQLVYYIYSYGRLLSLGEIREGEEINVSVPTGNFGNILAAYFAKRMGLPIRKLLCASNENRVLTDFFESGFYDRRRSFLRTSSPSMDILISSNLERLLYLALGRDGERCRSDMASLSEEGSYRLTGEERSFLSDFYGGFAKEEDCFSEIRHYAEKEHCFLDPHTAVAASVLRSYRRKSGDDTRALIVGTASPFKFAPAVLRALGKEEGGELFSKIDLLSSISGLAEPEAIREARDGEIKHSTETKIGGMRDCAERFLFGEA